MADGQALEPFVLRTFAFTAVDRTRIARVISVQHALSSYTI